MSESVTGWATPTRILELFKEELANLHHQATSSKRDLPEHQFLKLALSQPFAGLEGIHKSANPKDSNTFYLDQAALTFHLSTKFLADWADMASTLGLTEGNIRRALRSFVLHEAFHIKQGLTSPRHADARSAQACLAAIDYYADMCATISDYYYADVTAARWQEPFAECMAGTWHAIHLFNEAQVPLTRFKRMFLTHYQYHRTRAFRGENPKKLQLLYYPAVDFFSLKSGDSVNAEVVIASWDKVKKAESGEPSFMRMVVPDQDSIPRWIRYMPQRERVESLAKALFGGRLEDSHPYFERLFDDNPELFGGLGGNQPDKPIARHLDGGGKG